MVKIWRYSIAVVSLALVLLFGGGSWLLYSAAGTSWLLNRLPEWTGIQLTIAHIDGSIGDTLQLADIVVTSGDMQLQIGHLVVGSRLSSLMALTLEISELRIEQLHIKSSADQQNSSAPTPKPTFQWPELPWFMTLVDVDIHKIALRDFSWQQNGQEPLLIAQYNSDLQLHNGQLQCQKAILHSELLDGRWSFTCQLDQPLIQLSAQVTSAKPSTPWQQLRLDVDLHGGSATQILQGNVVIGITAADSQVLDTTAQLGLTNEQLTVNQLQLRRLKHPGKITATSTLQFSATPQLSSQLQISNLDLRAESGQELQLSGGVTIKGNAQGYHGQFDLHNQGDNITEASLKSDFNGDAEHLVLNNLKGIWLAGTIGGQARIGWVQGWQLTAHLLGRDINTQRLYPQLAGNLNFDLHSDLSANPQENPLGQINLTLHDSVLHQRPVSGSAQLQLHGNEILVEQLQLQGDGMLFHASGNPSDKLAFNWQIEHLEQLLADATGECSGNGWLRWHDHTLSANVKASAAQLAFDHWHLAKLNLQASTADAGGAWQLHLTGQRLDNQQLDLGIEQLDLALNGTGANHVLTLELAQQPSSLVASVSGGWNGQQWNGELVKLHAVDFDRASWQLQQPVALVLSAQNMSSDQLSLRSANGSALQLQGNYQPPSNTGSAQLNWQQLDLALFRPLLADWYISGHSTGTIELQRGAANQIHGKITLSGAMEHQLLKLQVEPSEVVCTWDEQGLSSMVHITLANGGNLHGSLTSAQGLDFALLRQGEVQLNGSAFPLTMVQPWLPPELNVTGNLGWQSSGSWQPAQPLNLTGTAHIDAGRFYWQEEDGLISADISAAILNWQWQERLVGKLDIQLSKQGSIATDFNLPLSATLPLALDSSAPVNANLHAQVQELGLVALFFPERIQESHGQLKLDLQLSGNSKQPILLGNFHLADAGVFLPNIGVQLTAIDLRGDFAEDKIEITNLQLSSGKGKLSGTGHLELQKWQPAAYHLQLKGQNFQLINLAEMQIDANPDLAIDGNENKVKVRGQVEFPSVMIRGQQITAQATNSPDLLVVDKEIAPKRQPKLQHDIDLKLILGKEVFLKTAGIDARLDGNLQLQSTPKQELVGNGKIRIVKGKYSSYGVSLGITRGNLLFSGGPLDQPTLDILALRKSGEVQAGVKVSGTPKVPVVQLYSEPTMAETDILSYIVIGRPVSGSSGETDLLMTAAGALLSQGESVMLQEKLKKQLGLDVLEVSAGDGDVNSSIITTGKYLNPDLYISLGYSLFRNTNEVKVRYSLTPVWEVESSFGSESGVDMFYKIEIE
jgi:translocation and assembly module TamB